MEEDERLTIIKAIRIVNKALVSIDKDKTQRETLSYLAKKYISKYDLFFANGGDQNNKSIPELGVCKDIGIGLIEGLGN